MAALAGEQETQRRLMWLVDYFLPIYGPNDSAVLSMADRLNELPPSWAQAVEAPLTIWEVTRPPNVLSPGAGS